MTNKFAPIAALTDTDAYKLDHRRQYPKGTTGVLSNLTPRGSRVEGITHVVQFGLQRFLQKWAIEAWEEFWTTDEDTVASLYEEFVTSVLGPVGAAQIGSEHVRVLHRKGFLPLKFRALPEGSLVPLRVPMFTVENTDPESFWLVNYVETAMSSEYWMPSTSATTAYRYRKLMNEWAIKTTGSTAGVEFQGHDFSFRGMEGVEAAAASGMGHNLSFYGSDNLNVINAVNSYYAGDDNGMILGSVAATEHSVMCAGATDAPRNEDGQIDEIGTYQHLLDLYPSGIVSAVSDTYDLWAVIESVLPRLKDQILARDGKLVIRPDSGDPVDILTGTPTGMTLNDDGVLLENERVASNKGVIELLWEIFGGTTNDKGFKVLDPHIGAIYGDSITPERAKSIFERLAFKGFASTNVVLGIGSFTYQYVTRDTYQTAVKATWVEIDGKGYSIFKDPITDKGHMKRSAKGRLAVIWKDDDYALADDDSDVKGSDVEGTPADMLREVWEDGEFVKYYSYAEVRANLHPEGIQND